MQYKLIPIIEHWIKSRRHFDEVTAKDDANPAIKPIRDKYLEADHLWTFVITGWFTVVDPDKPLAARRAALANYADSYDRALSLLTEAHAMVEKAIYK